MNLVELSREEKQLLFEGTDFCVDGTYYEDADSLECSAIYWYDEIGVMHYHVF